MRRLEIDGEPPARLQLTRLMGWLQAVWSAADLVRTESAPYLVVSPLGLPHRQTLVRRLAAHGVSIVRRLELRRWPRVSTAVHVEALDEARLSRAALYERAWRTACPGGLGEAWQLTPRAHGTIAKLKREVRAGLPVIELTFRGRSELRGVLHAFHLAEPEDARTEARRLEVAIAAPRRGGARFIRSTSPPPFGLSSSKPSIGSGGALRRAQGARDGLAPGGNGAHSRFAKASRNTSGR